ncbi:primosomal protein DnaI [Alkalihalobacillus sp. R86527]|uniref:primosomal protein DnaI n=1 Tax=Alkalihalobacillus sp. R86527 TaxID=3093863 RepID=UPI003670EF31
MESIQESFNKMPANNKIQQQYKEMKKAIMADSHIRAFCEEHEEVDDKMIDRSLARLYEFTTQTKGCEGCPGLSECINMMDGYEPELFINRTVIDIRYNRCPTRIQEEDNKKRNEMVKSYYIPKEILNATFADIDDDGGRIEAFQAADQYVEDFVPGETSKGLYIHGGFGVGKTFLLGAIANQLAKEKGVQSQFIYTPDFFRQMKSAIQDQSIDEKLNFLKETPLLILDDIGAENISTWVRDDILGTLLQYRMTEGLPTLYSSNLDYDLLEEHLAYSNKAGVELTKAKRIMERIKHYTTPVFLEGKNRRK